MARFNTSPFNATQFNDPKDRDPQLSQNEIVAQGRSRSFLLQQLLNYFDDADVRVTVRLPDGDETPYTMRPLGNGRYALDAGSLPPGDYRFTATASRAGSDLGTDAGAFAVGALTLEFRETTADASLMRQLARRSGGAPPSRVA